MKLDQFEDEIEKDLAWRKLELSQLFYILNKSDKKDVVLKSMILLLYAHWEGFIKKSSKLYLKYIIEQKVKIKELTLNFKAIALKKYASECIDNDGLNLSKEIAFINKQSKMEDKKFEVYVNVDDDLEEDIINTKHNLNSKVLKNITNIVGMKYNAAMLTRGNYIDFQLLKSRNAIGHGSKLIVDPTETFSLCLEDIQMLKDFIFTMLDYYAQVLMDYAAGKFYLISNNTEREKFEEQKEKELTRSLEELEKKSVKSS